MFGWHFISFFFLTFISLYNYAPPPPPPEYKVHEDRDRVYVVTLDNSGHCSEINGDEQMCFERIAWEELNKRKYILIKSVASSRDSVNGCCYRDHRY